MSNNFVCTSVDLELGFVVSDRGYLLKIDRKEDSN